MGVSQNLKVVAGPHFIVIPPLLCRSWRHHYWYKWRQHYIEKQRIQRNTSCLARTSFVMILSYQNRSPSRILFIWLINIFSNVGPSSDPRTWSSASPPTHKSTLFTLLYKDCSFFAIFLLRVIWLNDVTPRKYRPIILERTMKTPLLLKVTLLRNDQLILWREAHGTKW